MFRDETPCRRETRVRRLTGMATIILIANSSDGTISVLELRPAPRPRLEVLATSGDVPGCSCFAVDAERDLVFAAFKGENSPGIATLRLDRETGHLQEVARTDVEASLNYLELTDDRSALLGVSYSGGVGMVWPVDGERLGQPHSHFHHRNLHAIIQAGDFVYAPALGDDLVAQFRLSDGALTPLEPATVDAPAGSGPRHIIASGDHVYLLTEFSGEAIRYERDDEGRLVEAERTIVVDPDAGLSHSRFGADPRAEQLIWGADLHVAGSYLLTSERTSSQIASLALDEHGHFGEVVAQTPVEAQPRGFNVTDDGQFALVVGERSTHATLLRVDADGELSEVDRVGIGAGANWVRII